MDKENKEIKFHFHPYDYDNSNHTISKEEEDGLKRKYLVGVSSGLLVDAHGERMTEKCIKSFMDQANSGEILLYTDVHGIRSTEDIGVLSKAEIKENGDWFTEYKLHDKKDGIGDFKAEKIEVIWNQLNGLPPYKKPRQKGFSVEGLIPTSSIITGSDGEVKRSVLDDVILDGVVLVPRPAYKDSIATAIYKALGETTPERVESIKFTLKEVLEQEEIEDKYRSLKWRYQDALEETIEKIMTKKNTNKEEELDIIFDEYKSMMISLILQSQRSFVDDQSFVEDIEGSLQPPSLIKDLNSNSKLELYKSLLSELKNFSKLMEA